VNGSNGPLRIGHARAIARISELSSARRFLSLSRSPTRDSRNFHLSIGNQKTPKQFQSRPATQCHYSFAAGVVAFQIGRGIAAAHAIDSNDLAMPTVRFGGQYYESTQNSVDLT